MPTEPDELQKPPADLWNTLDLWKPDAVSPDFDRRLFATIDARNRSNRVRLRMLSSVATLLLAFALTALWFRPDPASIGPAPAVPHSASLSDAQNVVQTLSDVDMLKQIDSTRSL